MNKNESRMISSSHTLFYNMYNNNIMQESDDWTFGRAKISAKKKTNSKKGWNKKKTSSSRWSWKKGSFFIDLWFKMASIHSIIMSLLSSSIIISNTFKSWLTSNQDILRILSIYSYIDSICILVYKRKTIPFFSAFHEHPEHGTVYKQSTS